MMRFIENYLDKKTLNINTWCSTYGKNLMLFLVLIMVIASLPWLGYQFWRLLLGSDPIWPSSPIGAMDLKQRYYEMRLLFNEGFSVKSLVGWSGYPPASYVILWPFLGWMDVASARWLWGATTIIALCWLVYLVVQQSGAKTRMGRLFVALMPISIYATGASIGNGQLAVHILPALIFGILLLRRGQSGWLADLIAAALIIFTFVKPSLSVPFFWIVVFATGSLRLRPALFVSLVYIALTLFAISFQKNDYSSALNVTKSPENLISHNLNIHDQRYYLNWLEGVKSGLKYGFRGVSASGYIRDRFADLPIWLGSLGLWELILPTSILVFIALGIWTYYYRNVDIWLLLGVTALVTRFLTYHGWYDDLLILLPMVTLYRIATNSSSEDGNKLVAGLLLAITVITMLSPGGLYLFQPPWNTIYGIWQVVVWMFLLIFLLDQTRREKKRNVEPLRVLVPQ